VNISGLRSKLRLERLVVRGRARAHTGKEGVLVGSREVEADSSSSRSGGAHVVEMVGMLVKSGSLGSQDVSEERLMMLLSSSRTRGLGPSSLLGLMMGIHFLSIEKREKKVDGWVVGGRG